MELYANQIKNSLKKEDNTKVKKDSDRFIEIGEHILRKSIIYGVSFSRIIPKAGSTSSYKVKIYMGNEGLILTSLVTAVTPKEALEIVEQLTTD